MLTMQEAFDKMWSGLQKQGWERCHLNGECRYRLDHLKCAVGHLWDDDEMPDEVASWPGSSRSMVDARLLPLEELPWDTDSLDMRDFLMEAQRAHDAEEHPDMEAEFRRLALRWDLSIPETEDRRSSRSKRLSTRWVSRRAPRSSVGSQYPRVTIPLATDGKSFYPYSLHKE